MTALAGQPLQDPLFPRPSNFPFPVLVLLMALAVSGCGLMPEGEAASPAAAPPGNPQAPPGLAVARVSPPSAAVPAPAPASAPAPPEPAPPEPARPEKTYPEPAHLSGLDGSRVLALLGVPNLKRRDDPAQIWQYQTRACTLYIFLYRAAKGDAYKVRHFETSARGKDGVSAKACFVGLLKAHERSKAG
ncbi:MAG: hypothetical protein IIC56_02895 [Proteobacteria bacterium]|nr:hypothetical protein [Pseudomonadota bacterium]